MHLRAEQLDRISPVRFWLVRGAAFALFLGACGCGDSGPRAGGANTPKARENRKVAERAVLESIQFAAREQVAKHPELKRKNAIVRAEQRVEEWLGLTQTVNQAEAPPPPAPAIPTRPAPPPDSRQQVIIIQPKPKTPRISRSEPPRSAPVFKRPVVVSEKVTTGIPYPTEAEAEAKTIEEAQKLLQDRLRKLDPPLVCDLSEAEVRNEYLKKESKLVRLPNEMEKNAIAQAGYSPDRKYVEYTVEITKDQVRELRTRNRTADAFRVLGILTALSLAGFFFLRLDDWSKGYLTSWLALIAAALGGGIIAAVVLA